MNCKNKPSIPSGFSYLIPNVDRLLREHPSYDSNVFLIMRFMSTEPMQRIYSAIRQTLTIRGLTPLRADDKSYHPELWGNICTYMLGCSKAIVVFEDVELREFNPNVALELGFILSQSKPCLILKEKRLPRPPADIIGHLWREFDSFRPDVTLEEQVSRWVVDIDWEIPNPALPLPVARFILHELSSFHRTLRALKGEFDRLIDYDEEAVITFTSFVARISSSNPFFRKNNLLAELANDDLSLSELFKQSEGIGHLFQSEVYEALNNRHLNYRTRIKCASNGLDRVLKANWELIRSTQDIVTRNLHS